jgi:hypothetical protein
MCSSPSILLLEFGTHAAAGQRGEHLLHDVL